MRVNTYFRFYLVTVYNINISGIRYPFLSLLIKRRPQSRLFYPFRRGTKSGERKFTLGLITSKVEFYKGTLNLFNFDGLPYLITYKKVFYNFCFSLSRKVCDVICRNQKITLWINDHDKEGKDIFCVFLFLTFDMCLSVDTNYGPIVTLEGPLFLHRQ